MEKYKYAKRDSPDTFISFEFPHVSSISGNLRNFDITVFNAIEEAKKVTSS